MNLQAFNRQSAAAALVALSLIASPAVLAQSAQRLSLFDPVDAGASAAGQAATVTNTPATPGAIAFVLIGTSQIGDRYRARLRNTAGETVTVDLNPQGSTPVPGYPGFEVSRVNARELVVQHPSSSPCMGSQDQGVSCTDSHQSRLELATAAAVVRAEAPDPNIETGEVAQNNASAESGTPPENPFAAALRAARERGEQVDPAVMRAEGARFRPRRIDPADVPPGAQLIRTPFGDRIVTQ